MNANLLSKETSPYLQQHRDNPVHWLPWGDAAFARAEQENKPILLSIGYAACHWCHVMAHESFEDEDVAAVMNELFVNVKVDREERPDVDRIYMTALQAMGDQGGWPLTMFLTPKGEPFWGGTYFPKTARYGRPGFIDVLTRISEIFTSEPDKVSHNATAIAAALNADARAAAGDDSLDMTQIDEIAGRTASVIDPSFGGIRSAPKFPHVPMFELMWRGWLRSGNRAYRDAVVHTLKCICQGGIYDHLGGGFARYTVDERWLVPHFEKMLYDNAQLIRLMTLVWQETREPLFEQRIRETIAWLQREMMAEGDAFAASLDADSEGEEGKFYVWSKAEITEVLGPDDAGFFGAIYDATDAGNWEGKTILNRLARLDLEDEETEARLAACRARLLDRRSGRVRPGFDDKVLTDWNGLMISSLAWAGFVFAEPDWRAMAERAFAFIRHTMWSKGRLKHSARAGRVQHAAIADGYANMIQAALSLFQTGADRAHLEQAMTWYDEMEAHYWNGDKGGYHHAAADVPHLIARTFTATDDATPNANGTMVHNGAVLGSLTGETRFAERAMQLVDTFSADALSYPFAHGTLINGFERLANPLEVVLAGDPDTKQARALLEALNRHSLPDMALFAAGEGTTLPTSHPAHGKGPQGGSPVLYVCRQRACSLPLADPGDITAALFARSGGAPTAT